MSQIIKSKLVGVSKKNDDGERRQKLLELVDSGDSLILERESWNEHDENAIAVYNQSDEQLGYLNRRIAKDLSLKLDAGFMATCTVMEVTGGDEYDDSDGKSNIGCNVKITVYSADEWRDHPVESNSINTSDVATKTIPKFVTKTVPTHYLVKWAKKKKEERMRNNKTIRVVIGVSLWAFIFILILAQCTG